MKSVTKTKVTVRQRILNLLRKVDKPLDAKTIAKRGKLNYNTVRKELGILWRNAILDNSGKHHPVFPRKVYFLYS